MTESNIYRILVVSNEVTIPDAYFSIDSLVQTHEQDVGRAAALAAARKRLAKALEVDSKPTLASLRLHRGLSQAKLATLMGTSQPRLSRIECGLDDVHFKTFEKFVAILEFSRDEIAEALKNCSEAS